MRRSRIAQETSRYNGVVQTNANGLHVQDDGRRRTRSFAKSLSNFAANGAPAESRSRSSALASPPPEPKSRKRKREGASAPKNPPDEAQKGVEIHAPPRWREVYDAVKDMRARHPAPVDTMGCERLAEDQAPPKDQRFQTLIALMLSSQTKDTTTSKTIWKLQAKLQEDGGLCVSAIQRLPAPQLNETIWQVGFHNTKTKNIKTVADILATQYGGDIPATLEGLMGLPGVGPKMAYLCLAAAWGRVEGIGVDVHVHRITNLWRWHKSRGTTSPEETRLRLEAWLPRELWHEINHLLVGFGQTICLPQRPRCWDCDVGRKGLCPSMNRSARAQVKKEQLKSTEPGVKKGSIDVTVGEAEINEPLEPASNDSIRIKPEEKTVVTTDIEDIAAPAEESSKRQQVRQTRKRAKQ